MAERLVGGAHRGRRVTVHVGDLVPRRDPPAGAPQRARAERRVLDVVIEHRRWRNALVTDAGQPAILARAQRDRLYRRRLVADHRVHLCAGELQSHRSLQHLRRERRQQGMWPDIGLAAEAAAQEMGHDVDLLRRYAEHDRHQLLGAEDVLGGFIEGERTVGVPDRRRRVRLHLVVVAIGRRVGSLDADRGSRDCLLGIPDRRRDRPQELRRVDGVLRRLRTEHHRALRLVLDPNQRGGMGRLVERRGDHQRNRLAGIVDPLILKRQIRLPMRVKVAPGLWRRVHARHASMGEHRQHARHLFGDGSVDRHRPAVRDGAGNDRGVRRVCERNIRRVARGAGHLEPPVEP